MMKKLYIGMLLILLLTSIVLGACGKDNGPVFTETENNPTAVTESDPTAAPEQAPATLPETTGSSETENIFTDWLPAGVEQVMAETEENPELAQAIIDYYKIPEDAQAQTKYYYNYVDLNGDGAEEILAVVMGPYTSGSGGSSMLWVLPYADMAVNQSFTLIHTPIIVTKEATNGREFGAKGLIVQRSGGGAEPEFVLLTCSDGVYTEVNEGEVLESLDGVEGTAIICNDLFADMENGNYLTLANS